MSPPHSISSIFFNLSNFSRFSKFFHFSHSIPRSTLLTLPIRNNYYSHLQSTAKLQFSKIAIQLQRSIMEQTPSQQCNKHVCSIIPPNLLVEILRHDGLSEPTRAAVSNTLKACFPISFSSRFLIANHLPSSASTLAPRASRSELPLPTKLASPQLVCILSQLLL